MKKSISKNYIYNLLFQILTVIFPLITTPYLSRVMGAENIGIFSYTLSVTTYFVLISSLGTNLYGQREIAYNQDNKKKQSDIFNKLFSIKIFLSFISCILFLIYILISKKYLTLYLIWILEIISSLFDISWFFQGIEEFKKIIYKNLLVKILSLILIFIFVKQKSDLNIYIFIYCLTTFMGNLSFWLNLNKYIDFKFTFLSAHDFWKLFKVLLIFFIPQVATKIYTLLDKTMIGIFISDKSQVGYYEQSQKIIYLLLTILTSLGTIMMPRIATLVSKKENDKISDMIEKSFDFVFMIGIPLALGICMISKYLIPLYLGVGYDTSIYLLRYMSPIILIVGLSNITGIQLLIPLGKQKQYNISVVTGAIINLIFNIILIMNFGVYGAVISSVFSELIIFIIQLLLVKKNLKLHLNFKNIFKYIFAAILMIISYYLLLIFLNNLNDIFIMIVIIILMPLVYFLSLILLKENNIMFLINKLVRRIHRK